jgi:small GTP-binding protein
VWDTAGQERFRTITTSYFRGAQGILLVYDITDRESFNNVETWMSEIQRNADKNVNKVLVGNKCDMEGDRAVTFEEGKALADRYGIPFFETSAKADINVAASFEKIAHDVKDRLDKSGVAAARPAGGPRVDIKKGGAAGGAGGGKGGGGCCK